jgi:hypothetical protein
VFALSTKNQQQKLVYQRDAEELQKVMDQVKPLLTR